MEALWLGCGANGMKVMLIQILLSELHIYARCGLVSFQEKEDVGRCVALVLSLNSLLHALYRFELFKRLGSTPIWRMEERVQRLDYVLHTTEAYKLSVL